MAPGGLNPHTLANPVFEPLRPWLERLSGPWPDLDALNRLAAACGTQAPGGRPLGFCPPDEPAGMGYELHIRATGRVPTRAHNAHDLFNALAWLAFPRSKAAMNARHAARIPVEGSRRGPLRDLLTLFDESGVIVACADSSLSEALAGGHWSEVFWDRRQDTLRDLRFIVIGHSAYEKALTPYPGITCKSLFIKTPGEILAQPVRSLVEWLDSRAADWIAALPEEAGPRGLPAVPVFGYPGWLPGSVSPAFYAQTHWFRPRRQEA